MESFRDFGPKDKGLWVNRPLGDWEKQFLLGENSMQVPGGPARFTINSVFHLATNPGFEFDVDIFEKSVRATIYKQPHLRSRANLRSTPMRWLPAEDFDGVFAFVDRVRGKDGGDGENGNDDVRKGDGGRVGESGRLPERRHEGVAEVWDLVEEAANRPWNYDSFKPLYRCTLIKIQNGYVVMNTYHHATSDSRSGMHAMSDILEFYEAFDQGVEISLDPFRIRGSSDEETFLSGHESTLEKLIQTKIEKSQAPNFVLFDVAEARTNDSLKLPLTKTFFFEGEETNLTIMRKKCRKEKVTIGSLATAAHNFAVCVLRALQLENQNDFDGIKDHYTVVPVDIRSRLASPLGTRCGFYATNIYLKTAVELSTNLWDLARDIKQKIDQGFKEKHHFLDIQAKKMWKTGPTASLAAAIDTSKPDSYMSNVGPYQGRKKYPWGKIRAVHTTGFMDNFLFLLQSTDRMTYDVLSTPGEKNEATARASLEVVVDLMENAGDEEREVDLISVLRRHGIEISTPADYEK